MITIAQKTLGFRRAGFSPALSLLMPAFSLLYSPVVLAVDLQSGTERSSTTVLLQSKASVVCLAPIILGAESLDQ